MSAAHDLTKTAFIFKRTYAKRDVSEDLKRRHPLMRLIYGSQDWTGANDFRYAVMDANPQGVAGTFAKAQANNTGVSAGGGFKGEQFSAVRRKRFGFATLDGEAMAAAEDDNGALMRLIGTAVDGHLTEHEDTLAHGLFRDGTGVRGIVSAVSTTLITLTRQDDVRWFKRGMMILGSASTSGSSPRNSGMAVEVTKVDYANSQITTSSAISSLAAADYLFRNGEDATSGTVPMDGLQSIIPATAGTFRGVDCTVDRERYAGWYINDPTSGVVANTTEMLVRMSSYIGTDIDRLLVLHPRKANEVCMQQQAKVTYDGGGNQALIGFKTFKVMTPVGEVTCLPDPDCDITDGWVLFPKSWELKGLKKVPHLITDDDKKMLRVTDDDAVEFRSRSMCNAICYAPVLNGRFRLNA